MGGGQFVARLDARRAAIDRDRVAKAAQHALGVVAGWRRLGYRGMTCSIEAGQQQAGFDLRAGHGHFVIHAGQALTTLDVQRRTAFRTGFDHCAHLAQRLGDAVHRSLGQRGIAGQGGVERLRRQQAGEQTHRGTGVAHIQRASRRFQAMQANPVNGHATMMRTLDDHAHIAERLQSRQGVFTLEKALDLGGAFSQRAEHDRAVGDRLVARNANTPGEFAARISQKNQIIRVHSVHIGPAGQNFAEMLTGHAGAGENAQQLMPIPSVDRVAQGVEVVAKYVQRAQHRLAVGEEDVMPHDWITAGNPREITEAASGVTKYLQVLTALGQ